MTITETITDRLRSQTQVTLRPRYEGSNICTWIGFKHVNYLVEEAVLDHFRQAGYAPGELYERYALGVDIVDIDTKIVTAFHIDDVATATVTASDGGEGELRLAVSLTVERDGAPVKAVSSKVSVLLRTDQRYGEAETPPGELARLAVDRISRAGGGVPAGSFSIGRGDLGDAVLAELGKGTNSFVWRWRIPYFYCHFTERIQMSGYLRQMEEVVDLFLAERGVSIWTLLARQNWIPVVPHSAITILTEALMEEELYTVFTVKDIFKDFTYVATMDCYVVRDGKLVHTATGNITHGYAVINDNRRDWQLVNFDQALLSGLRRDEP